jgi:hypothetical protein
MRAISGWPSEPLPAARHPATVNRWPSPPTPACMSTTGGASCSSAGDPPPPKMRTAAHAWLWFMDGAILDWLDHRDLSRTELRDLLLGSLAGSLSAAGSSP